MDFVLFISWDSILCREVFEFYQIIVIVVQSLLTITVKIQNQYLINVYLNCYKFERNFIAIHVLKFTG